MVELFINQFSYAYKGVYQKVGPLPGLSNKDCLWTIFGAALHELVELNFQKNLLIYTDEDDISVGWTDPSKLTAKSHCIRNLLHKLILQNNAQIRIEKVDPIGLSQKIDSFKKI